MSFEFRQRGIGEYLDIIKRQMLVILLPTLAVGAAVGYVVWNLPSVYESKTSLKINPPSISEKVVQSLTDADASERINAITEEVKSRSSLEPMITKFSLYEAERAAGKPMELIVEQMRRNINVAVVKADNEKATNLTIAFRDRDPDKARAATAELGSKYIKAQQETSIKQAEATREFFDKELGEVKTKLDDIDKRRLAYMMQNVNNLPTSTAGLIAQLQGVREKERTLETEIGRLRDQYSFLEREKNTLLEYSEKEAQRQQQIVNDVRRTPVYAEMIKKRADLEAQLKNLLTQYREAHPDVKAKKNEIEQVNKEITQLEEQTKTSNEEFNKSTRSQADLRIKGYDNNQQKINAEIARFTKEIEVARTQIGDLQRRIESVPAAEVALGTFEREYQTAKENYDELLKKKNNADLQAERERNAQGESITIVDGANTPQAPVAPKREMLLGMGLGVGLGIGLLFALLFEFPRFLTINNLEDAKHYTNLPVLAAVPELTTVREAWWQRSLMVIKVMGGLALTAASVPLLVIGLQTLRIFDRFVS